MRADHSAAPHGALAGTAPGSRTVFPPTARDNLRPARQQRHKGLTNPTHPHGRGMEDR